jgi:hypothetical protein
LKVPGARSDDETPRRNRQGFFGCLDFHYDQAADDQVNPETGFDPVASVQDRKSDLPLEIDLSCLQLVREASLVYRLQEPWPKRRMNSECGINNLAGNRIMLGRGFRHLGALASWR